jgi:hypothetical protein
MSELSPEATPKDPDLLSLVAGHSGYKADDAIKLRLILIHSLVVLPETG